MNLDDFVKGGPGALGKMTKEEEEAKGLKMLDYIASMDSEVKDRFMAIAQIENQLRLFDEEEEKAIKELELEYEEKYKVIYAKREAVINEKAELDKTLIEEFNARLPIIKDADYDKVEVPPCDVKGIQNAKGVSDFWMRCMLNHQISDFIKEKDRPILGYLENIELDLHKEDRGYDLIFKFSPNSYFKETVIRKTLFIEGGQLDKTTSTPITWKEGCNPTIKKQKKKKKGKKVNVETEAESFFNLFKDLDASTIEPKDDGKEDDDGMPDDVEMQLDNQMEMCEMLRDDIIPLALEYYLGVIEVEQPEGDDDGAPDDDSDDDKDKNPTKKKGGDKPSAGGAGGQQMPPGAKPEDCKQQ